MEVIELFRLQVKRFDSGFSFPDKIRSGSQGCVVAMVCKNGEKIASKIIDYSNRTNVNKAITDFEREYRSLQVLNHPSIVKFLNFEHHPAKKQAFLQMEWAGSELAESPGGAVDLADIIGHRQMRDGQSSPDYLPETFIWHVLFHLGAALALCHYGIELYRKKVPEEVDSRVVLSQLFGQSSDRLRSLAIKHPTIRWITERIVFSARESHEPIIHRDIKPRNILLSDPPREPSTQTWRSNGDISLKDANVLRIYPVVLLGDFGFSAPLRDAQTRGIGTIGYAAPEVPLEPDRPDSGPFEWKTSCDIFSLGATIRHLMTLQSPPEYAVNSTAWPPFPSVYSEQVKHLVSRCHHFDPSQRPTAIEVLDACIRQHRWDQTYIGPYGVPITANFTTAMTRSWSECLQAMAPVKNFDPPRSMQLRTAEGFGFQTVDILALDRQTEASSLTMLIAGAYHYQLFRPKAKYSLPPRNSQFVNRPHLLQGLRSRLNEETKGQVTIVLHGLGGIGKTQIALDLAYQLRDTDPGLSIFWVHGDNSSAFEESYRQLALVCGIPSGSGGDAGFLGRVKRWLESSIAGRWLMIIDNVDEVRNFYGDQTGGDTPPSRYIPCCAHGSLLFTARDSSLRTKIRPRPFTLQVPPLTPGEARDLILRITSHTKFTEGRVASIATLPAGELAAEITEALGHLPLAITQAASYMNMLDVSASEYLASFRTASRRLLRVQFPDTQRQRGMESIVSTLQITFEQLQQRSGSAMEVLALISFIHQDNIPVSLLRSAFSDKLEFIESLSSLREFSFINANENGTTYSVHPLIQSTTMALLESRGTREEHALRIWQLLDQNIPHTSSKDWEAALDLLPHAHSALTKTSNVKIGRLMRARFIMKITPYWTKLGRFASAEEIAREAIELLGTDHPDVADAYINLGYALLARGNYRDTFDVASRVSDSEEAHGFESKRLADALGLQGLAMQGQGKYSSAVEVHKREVSIRESADPSSPISWASKMNLAHALERKGDYELAEKCYRSSLRGRAVHFGAEHPDTIACMSDLAVALQHQSRNSEALALLEQAVEHFAKTLGESSPQALKASVRLASVKMDLDQIKEAEELYASTLSKMENVFGKEHPDTIECLSRLGDVYFVEGESSQAESTFQMAIETSTTNLGAEHPLTLSIMKSAARNHQLQQRLAEAESMYRSILASRRNVLGIDHPDTIDSMSDLASVLYDRGRLDVAEDMYERVLRGMEKVLGCEHTSTLQTVNDLGNLYKAQGRLDEARAMYERALQGYEKALGSEHTSTLNTVNNLGNLYADQGRLSDAEAMYERALQGKERVLGPKHTSALNTINNLGLLYTDQGRLSDAEAMYERTLQGYEKALGPEHPSTLNTINNLGLLYADQGRLSDAEAMYERALQGYEKVLGPGHPSVLNTVNNLGNLYADQGRLSDAEAMYERALQGYERALGSEHTSTLNTVNNLGNLYKAQGRLNKARAMYERALRGMEKALGREHPSTLQTANDLGNLYTDQGRLSDAEAMYERTLQGYQKVLGPEHSSTLNTINNLGLLYADQGRLSDAEAMYERALQGYEKVLGSEHTSTLNTVNNLGNLYADQGRLSDAEAMYERALQGYEKVLGPEHSSTLNMINNLGNLYKAQGRLSKAKVMYERALQGYEKALGPEHPSTLQTVDNLSKLYISQGWLNKARAMYERARRGMQKALGREPTSTLQTVNALGNLHTPLVGGNVVMGQMTNTMGTVVARGDGRIHIGNKLGDGRIHVGNKFGGRSISDD